MQVNSGVNIKDCLECPLFRCDEETKGGTCRFVLITVDEHLQAKAERLRQQKREHNVKVRAERRAEIPELRLTFSRLLAEYGSFGRHSELMRKVRAQTQQRSAG